MVAELEPLRKFRQREGAAGVVEGRAHVGDPEGRGNRATRKGPPKGSSRFCTPFAAENSAFVFHPASNSPVTNVFAYIIARSREGSPHRSVKQIIPPSELKRPTSWLF